MEKHTTPDVNYWRPPILCSRQLVADVTVPHTADEKHTTRFVNYWHRGILRSGGGGNSGLAVALLVSPGH